MLVSLLVFVLILGLIIMFVNYLPLPPPFKTIALCIVCIIAILWLLDGFGPVSFLPYHHRLR